jgi:hypothetical protein
MKYLKFLLIVVCLYTLSFLSVNAHTLKIDGTTGAVFHIDPNDEPSAHEPVTLYFDFKNTDAQFELEKCKCIFSITNEQTKNVDTIASSTVVYDNSTASFKYVFPITGEYSVEVRGFPMSGSNSSLFTLRYDVSVTKEQSNTSASSTFKISPVVFHTIHYGIFALGGVIVIIVILVDKFKGKSAGKN